MSRLVVVSNRTADPRKAAAGGLAVAVKESCSRPAACGLDGAAKSETKRSPSLDIRIFACRRSAT